MGLLQLCFLSLLSPQDPPTPPPAPAAGVADPAAWLPPSTMLALVLHPTTDPARLEGAWQTLVELDPQGVLRSALAEAKDVLRKDGMSTEQIVDLARGGLGFAFRGVSPARGPLFTLTARTTTTGTAWQETFARHGRATEVVGTRCHELQLGPVTLHGGMFDGHLVLTTEPEALPGAVAATRTGATAASLATDAEYTAATKASGLATANVTLFVRPAELGRRLGVLFGPQGREPLERALGMLGVASLPRLCVRALVDENGIETAFATGLPTSGLLATLAGDPLRMRPELARLVPPSATEYALCTVDLGAVVLQALDAIGTLQPAARRNVETMFQGLRRRTEVDVGKDVLGATTGQIVAVRMPDGFAAAFGVRDGAAWQRAIAALLPAAGFDTEAVTVDGTQAMQIETRGSGGGAPVLGTVGNWFVVAEGATAFGTMAARIRRPGSGDDAADVLMAIRSAGPGVTVLQRTRGSDDHATAHRRDDAVVLRSRAGFTGMRAALGLAPLPPRATAEPRVATNDSAPKADADELAQLRAAERAGAEADPLVLARLAASSDEAVAGRAAWLLGQHPGPDAAELLQRTAGSGHGTAARRQAMAALARRAPSTGLATGIAGLDDEDRVVRTFAAQLLGRLRRPASVPALIAAIDRARRTDEGKQTATDLQAAVLALHDLEAKEHLLTVATALHDCRAVGTGECLAFWFQDHLPTLPVAEQTTLLLAVLDHREPLLRRYALGRLAELSPPPAEKALEGRLAKEGDELRPLVEVALAHVRQGSQPAPDNETDRAIANVQAMLATVAQRWHAADALGKSIVVGTGAGLVLAFVLFLVWWNKKQEAMRQAAAAAATAALIAPSDEYLAEVAAEAEALAAEAEWNAEANGDSASEAPEAQADADATADELAGATTDDDAAAR